MDRIEQLRAALEQIWNANPTGQFGIMAARALDADDRLVKEQAARDFCEVLSNT
jgi:hypothetical protein